MTLEKTLAEIEVLATELNHNANLVENDPISSNYLAFCNFYHALAGIEQDAKLVYRKYAGAKKAIKKHDIANGSTLLSEMAMDCKNLADNLNIFMQTLYGEYNGKLGAIETNTRSAPKTNNDETLYQVFSRTHDHSKESLVKNCRDSKGHVRGHTLLSTSKNHPSGWRLYFAEPGANRYEPDAIEFLDSQAKSYLEMTKTILQTIADKDKEHFLRKNQNRKLKTLVQQTRNFYQRHSKPLAIAIASTLLTAGAIGGSLGTITYQNYQRQKEMQGDIEKRNQVLDWKQNFRSSFDNWENHAMYGLEKEVIEKRKIELQKMLITRPVLAPWHNLERIFGTSTNLFEQTIEILETDSKKLGTYIDNYLIRVPLEQTNPPGKTKEFLSKRAAFIKQIREFSDSEKGKIPSPASLETLDKLIQEEKALFDLESDIVSFFPRLK